MANRMPTYVYCLVSASHEPPVDTPCGLDGAPVRAVHAGRIIAWASDVADRRPAPTLERVRAHDAVVRRALDGETPLPARFGQTFADDTAVAERVREREQALLDALDRVRGMVEMTVRVRLDVVGRDPLPIDRAEGLRGHEYLAQLRERQRAERAWRDAADGVQSRVSTAVSALASGETSVAVSGPERWLSISHLVARDAVTQYRAVLETLSVSDPALRLAVSGPWAPYSFAEVARV